MGSQLSIELTPDDLDLLAVLGRAWPVGAPPSEDPMTAARAALEHLVHSAINGVRRPMSWERGWLAPAFGDEWADQLEPDPAVPHYTRPKGQR